MVTKNIRLHELMQDFKNGKAKTVEEIYINYNILVRNIAFSILKNKDDSEEIMQEVFIKIHNIAKEKLPETGEINWLYVVTKNITIDFIKKKKIQLI